MLTFYRRPVCDAEARDISLVEPRQVQGHFHPFLHFDAGHSAVAAEGSDPDHGGVDAAADVVSDSVRAAHARLHLPQARSRELQLEADALVGFDVPDESSVEGGQHQG